MSVQELAHSLQRKLRSEFPLHLISESNLNIDDFLSSCFAGRTHNLFNSASLLKQDLKAYLDSTQKSLSHHIQMDFDKLIKIPDLLLEFEEEIQVLHKSASEFCEETNLIYQRARDAASKAAEAIKIDNEEQANLKKKRESEKIEMNLSEVEAKLPALRQVSNECMNNDTSLNHGALFERISRALAGVGEILKGGYNALYSQLKSDFLLLLSRELVAWSTSKKAERHFKCLLRSYKHLNLESEAQVLLRDKSVLPILNDLISGAKVQDTIDLTLYFKLIQEELSNGRLILYISAAPICNILLKSLWSAVFKSISNIPTVYLPTFQQEYLQSISVTMKFIDYLASHLPNPAQFKDSQEYQEFKDRLNLPTFFELKKKEIIGPLCKLLKSESLEILLSQNPSEAYIAALKVCWDKALQIEHLKARFMKLSFQIVSTFVNFITRNLNFQSKNQGVGIDILVLLVKEVKTLKERISEIEMGAEVLLEKESLLQNLLDPCTRCLAEALTRQCLSNLEAIRSIPASYRMTNRPSPINPSPFVGSFLQPLKQINLESGSKQRVVEKILIRYLELVNETYQQIRKSGELLSKYTPNAAESDQEKMMKQIEIDTKFVLDDLEGLGFTEENSELIAQLIKEVIKSN
ncbi:unnamed protein product [Blepharisma stoltei]|uniref:COG complex component COG2 C-terminal domain-containing protein n=1 Tax=Blepharisma stoltei TaxID=1481888 RepID=A0AAU9JIC0_9CILI|nr:unnamed protein product [Blepharisma stoltei]